MGALTIAFDTTIVGALALPWVLLVIHLFFFEGENKLAGALDWVKAKEQQASAGVLLFAMSFTLGSAVSRTARDFFNDDDLRVQVGSRLLRVGVTQDRIVASVYCHAYENNLVPSEAANPAIAREIAAFQIEASPDNCQRTLRWKEPHKYNKKDDNLIDAARDLFGLQENALLLKGEDPTLRLRQLHDQIMVLRGAAFNGVIAVSLCLFAWGATLRRAKPRSWLPFLLMLVPVFLFALGIVATVNHYGERAPSDPPYMEFTLLLLGSAGAWLVGSRPSTANQQIRTEAAVDHARREETAAQESKKKCEWQIEHCPRLVALSAILTLAAVLAWWSTEVLYAQQVIYSYDSQGTFVSQK